MMQGEGIQPGQVSQVRGFADQHLRNLKDALDPSNRRVSIIVQYIDTEPPDAAAASKEGTESGEVKSSTPGTKEPEPAAKK